MKVDVVVERDEEAGSGGAQPSKSVAADGEQDEGHVELESLGSALSSGETITHNLEGRLVPILEEFPGEQASHGHRPDQHNPRPLPIIFH